MRSRIYSILDIIQVNSLNFCKNTNLIIFYFVVTKKNLIKKN